MSGAEIPTLAVDTKTAVWASTAEKLFLEKLGSAWKFGVVWAPALHENASVIKAFLHYFRQMVLLSPATKRRSFDQNVRDGKNALYIQKEGLCSSAPQNTRWKNDKTKNGVLLKQSLVYGKPFTKSGRLLKQKLFPHFGQFRLFSVFGSFKLRISVLPGLGQKLLLRRTWSDKKTAPAAISRTFTTWTIWEMPYLGTKKWTFGWPLSEPFKEPSRDIQFPSP